MEKNRFVFESFEDFLKNTDSLLEANKDTGEELKIEGATELVDKIISLDVDLAENKLKKADLPENSATLIYGMKAIESLRKKEYNKATLYVLLSSTSSITPNELEAMKAIGLDIDNKTKPADKRAKVKKLADDFVSMSDSDAKKLAEVGLKSYKNNLPAKFKTPLLWGMLTDAEKGKVYDDFFKLAIKRGYSTKESLEKVIQKHYKAKKNDDSQVMVSPGVRVFLTREEMSDLAPPVEIKPEKTFLLDDEKSSDVFKPNKTGANGRVDFMEASFDELVDKLGSIFERYKAGEITSIKKINILTSADRYRNTEDAEKLSWGELSYARAIAMTKLVEGVAEAVGLDDDIISQLPKVTSIYAKGGNGDGTSGPNPPEPLKFGYYVNTGGSSKWTEGTDRSIVTLIPIDVEGTPTSENADGAKTKKEAPEANVADYNKFRYNNIEIEFETVALYNPKDEITSEKIVALKYLVKIQIPSRYTTKTIKIPIPSITTSSSSSGKSSKAGSCPSFKETTKLKLGLTFKTINILTYKSDLAKDLF
jgi:hypothetical protein